MNTQEINGKFDELLSITRENFAMFTRTAEAVLKAQRPLPLAVDEDSAPAELLQLDMALLTAAPIAAVPCHAPFHPLQDNGHRFLLAADGMYLEVRRPWLHFIHRLVEQHAVAMPYGKVEPRTELAFGRLGAALDQFRAFAANARLEAPNEWAAAMAWNAETRQLEWIDGINILDKSPSSLRYELPPLAEHASLVVDLHSHGQLPAFFSDTDDRDDAGSVKIAGVFGDLDKPNPTAAFRLCVLGLYIPIAVPADKIFG